MQTVNPAGTIDSSGDCRRIFSCAKSHSDASTQSPWHSANPWSVPGGRRESGASRRELHPNVLGADFGGISFHGPFGPFRASAGGDIEGPPVQRAMNPAAIHPPRTQRTSPMRAIVVDGIKSSRYIEQRESTSADLNGAALSSFQTTNFCDFDE